MKIYNLDILLSQFGTSLLFQVRFSLLLLDLYTDFSGGMLGVLVFHLFRNFPQFAVIHTVKGFGIVNETEVNVFLEWSCFFEDPADVAIWPLVPLPFLNPAWTSWSSRFMYCWKSSLKDFEHYLASMWNECSCAVVWTFFGFAVLWDWNENWPFPVLWPLLSFPNVLAYWVEHVNSIIS